MYVIIFIFLYLSQGTWVRKGGNWETNKLLETIAKHALECTKAISLLTLLHSERPNLYTILAFLSAIGLITLLKTDIIISLCL